MSYAKKVKIGLIIPPMDGTTPAECQQLYPNIDFSTIGLGVREMSRAGFDAVAERILDRAHHLRKEGVEAISLMGTSLTFYKGSDYNEELIAHVAAETGLPVTSMS